jgi:Hsp70 protein
VQWPDANGCLEGKTQEKVPTELIYNGSEVKWGFQIPEDELRYQWFKLGLDPNQSDSISHLSIEYPDPRALPPGYDHDPVRLTTDFLKCLRKHAYEILKLKLGKGVVDSTPLDFVLTVPACWAEAAQDRTIACASAAGMGSNVRIVSEPESAAVYTLDAMDPHNLKKGDKFVLCDAGGGTVDLITYEILELAPKVKVREAVPGDGDVCGGVFLNRIFAKYLDETFGEDAEWDEELQEEALRSFEHIKKDFTGDQKSITCLVNGLPDDARRGVKRGRLTFPATVVKSKFEVVIAMIIGLVKKQLKVAKTAKAVLLVGGFGGSVYLRKCIQRVVGDGIEVMQPAHGWTAVVKGALIWGLNDLLPEESRISIASRVARKHYGLVVCDPFDTAIHEKGRE